MAFPTVSRFLTISAVLASTAGIAGCSSATTTPPATQDPGLASPDSVLSTDANPYGVAYPSKGFGVQARVGSTPGGVFRNFKFYGYPDGDGSKGLQAISMAKYLDPEMRNYKVLVISLTGNWCTYCRQETGQIISKMDTFKTKKIGMLQAVAEGTKAGVAATQENFEAWVKDYKHNFDVFLDDGKRNLAPYFQSGGLPFNLVLDARTMEILYAGNGAPSNVETAYDKYVTWVDSHEATKYE